MTNLPRAIVEAFDNTCWSTGGAILLNNTVSPHCIFQKAASLVKWVSCRKTHGSPCFLKCTLEASHTQVSYKCRGALYDAHSEILTLIQSQTCFVFFFFFTHFSELITKDCFFSVAYWFKASMTLFANRLNRKLLKLHYWWKKWVQW